MGSNSIDCYSLGTNSILQLEEETTLCQWMYRIQAVLRHRHWDVHVQSMIIIMGVAVTMMAFTSGSTNDARYMGKLVPVTNKTIKYNSRPIYTVESLRDFLKELDAELQQNGIRSTKASRIRQFVSNLSGFLNERRMCLDAVADLAMNKLPNIGRGYFTTIVRKSWAVEKDENGVEWVRIDRPKGRWHK